MMLGTKVRSFHENRRRPSCQSKPFRPSKWLLKLMRAERKQVEAEEKRLEQFYRLPRRIQDQILIERANRLKKHRMHPVPPSKLIKGDRRSFVIFRTRTERVPAILGGGTRKVTKKLTVKGAIRVSRVTVLAVNALRVA